MGPIVHGFVTDINDNPIDRVVVSIFHCAKIDIPKDETGLVPLRRQRNMGSVVPDFSGEYHFQLRPSSNLGFLYNLWVEVRDMVTQKLLFRSGLRPGCQGDQVFPIILSTENSTNQLHGRVKNIRELSSGCSPRSGKRSNRNARNSFL